MGVSSDANLQMQICIGILSLNDDAMPALDCYPGSREELSQRLGRCAASAATEEMRRVGSHRGDDSLFVLASSSSVFPNLSPGAAYCAGASPYPGDAAAVGFGRRPRLYGGELQARYSNGEAIRGMVFKLGIVSSTWRLGH
jgi:hypothetical protein